MKSYLKKIISGSFFLLMFFIIALVSGKMIIEFHKNSQIKYNEIKELKAQIDNIDSKLELIVNQHPADIEGIRRDIKDVEDKIDILIKREDVWDYRKRK